MRQKGNKSHFFSQKSVDAFADSSVGSYRLPLSRPGLRVVSVEEQSGCQRQPF
jgi:hypothetical protein